jgi:predicted nucleotidyltransferase component of viral defense system
MSPSLEYLERCAAETGFQVIAIEKVVRLGELAGDVAGHPVLGEALALKGGSALNLCFGPPQRLSVDLDYNYIDSRVGRVREPGIWRERKACRPRRCASSRATWSRHCPSMNR